MSTPSSQTTARLVDIETARRRRKATGAVVVVLLVSALVGWAATRSGGTADLAIPARVPASGSGPSATGGGLVVGAGPTRVDVYYDYLCPTCKAAEPDLDAALQTGISEGWVTVVYHPMAHLDAYSNPAGYSGRAAAAAACAADEDRLGPFTQALFSAQPPEGGPGLTNDELVAVGSGVGLTSSRFQACVQAGDYAEWVTYVTEQAYSAGVVATPTVLLDGKPIDTRPDGLRDRLIRALAAERR